jgi:hypothetical protein
VLWRFIANNHSDEPKISHLLAYWPRRQKGLQNLRETRVSRSPELFRPLNARCMRVPSEKTGEGAVLDRDTLAIL